MHLIGSSMMLAVSPQFEASGEPRTLFVPDWRTKLVGSDNAVDWGPAVWMPCVGKAFLVIQNDAITTGSTRVDWGSAVRDER